MLKVRMDDASAICAMFNLGSDDIFCRALATVAGQHDHKSEVEIDMLQIVRRTSTGIDGMVVTVR